MLIYLRPDVQEKVLSLFHFALREGGILFLGASEDVGDFGDRFEPICQEACGSSGISAAAARAKSRSRSRRATAIEGGRAAQRAAPETRGRAPTIGNLARQALLDAYAPASVLINARHEGLYYFGPIDRYLKVAAGEASRDLLAMAREGCAPSCGRRSARPTGSMRPSPPDARGWTVTARPTR